MKKSRTLTEKLHRRIKSIVFALQMKTSKKRFWLYNGAWGFRQFFHRGSVADIGVIYQIFKVEDYALRRLKRGDELLQRYTNMIQEGKKPLILDLGSNIGASVVWFAEHFKGCHIVALEPDRENFQLLEKNTYGLDVDLYPAAIGADDGLVTLIDPGNGEWGYQTQVSDSGECQMISLTRLLNQKKSEGYSPFIVKIDIEGGEANLFSSSIDWVDRFPILIIELHDWLLPNQAISHNFIKCISQHDRDFVHIGENVFSIKN